MKYIIEKDNEGVRLDRYLRKKLKTTPLTEIFKALRIGKIKVNNKKKKENYRLVEGDKVFIGLEVPEEEIKFINLENKDKNFLKEGIVFEDKDLLIFNKKKDMVMHKGSGFDYGISEMFKAYFQSNDFNFVNRIDKKTSGLVIGAKNKISTRLLTEEIRENRVKKKYYILVKGIIDQDKFVIENYLKKIEDKVIVTSKEDKGSKLAVTIFKVIKRKNNLTLLEGELLTGRTHQLRVQLSNLGYPILGDTRYGNGREKMLFLNSFYCKIEKFNIEVKLELPKEFREKLK
ncbi:MAG: RluA family pseudouridine synthase [Fusobacterium sp. JB021]|nr:RluA family pseudouridine synthase [Fusobacterium sp. JB020]MDP0493435.1 RluA family pseudouridine synthase [Fusobacterium sp. JB021]MDP0507669.1 RluA family pseudouridine synthase [Fusobacterium sp. JB019]